MKPLPPHLITHYPQCVRGAIWKQQRQYRIKHKMQKENCSEAMKKKKKKWNENSEPEVH